jgi:hypothetical protein
MEPAQSATNVLFSPKGRLSMVSLQVGPQVLSCPDAENSKRQSERELYLPRRIGSSCDAPHTAGRDHTGGNLKLRMIEHVKKLNPE